MTPEHTALVNQLYGSVMGHDAEMLDKAARAIEDLSERLERAERVVEAGKLHEDKAKRQLRYDKERRTITSPDPRDPDHTRIGMFVLHNCWHCKDGREPCVAGNPHQCEYPHARND